MAAGAGPGGPPAAGGGDRGAVPHPGAPGPPGRADLYPARHQHRPGGASDPRQRRARPEGPGRRRRAVSRRPGRGGAYGRDRGPVPVLARCHPVPLSLRAPARRRHLVELAPPARRGGGAPALRRPRPRRGAGADRQGAGPHRRARLLRLLPHHVGGRRVLPPARHPVPGTGVGRQLGRLLLPRHHRRRPDPGRSAVRALPVARARRAPRHRPRHHARAPGGGDSVRLREVRARPGGDGRQRRPLSLPLGRPRGGEGAGAARDGGRPARQAVVPLRRRRPGHRGAGARRRRSRRRAPRAACRRDPGLSAPPVHPSRRVSPGPRAGARPGADRERGHGRTHRDSVGQGRPGGPRAVQGRPAGAGGADPARPVVRAAGAALPPHAVDGHDSGRGRGHLRHDLPQRHRRRLPDREPGADGDAAAAPAAQLLRPGHRGVHRPAGADHRRHGASVPAAA